jgi:phosphatidylglycerol---prolipoprotein diacylglyceryl transferase
MRQVVFWIPIPNRWFPEGLPVYGFGLMLFLTFVTCTWLASRRAKVEGINPQYLQDLAIWIFVFGIIGARITYMIQYGVPPLEFFEIWKGGLVFYGSAIGGVIGYAVAYYFVIRKHNLGTRQLADIVAPTVAWGLMLGRIGCLLNGCCYGHVACTEPNCSLLNVPPALSFPVHSPAWFTLVGKGEQAAAGFTMDDRQLDDRTVGTVDPESPAAAAGLRRGDVIVEANGADIKQYGDLWRYLVEKWPRGQTELTLTVERNHVRETLPAFAPKTLGLHPTQLYEAISMFLLFLLLNAFYPIRRHYGEVFVLLIVCYTLHRFVNEMLRNDTDPVLGTGMTLSQNGSLLFFAVGVGLLVWLWRRPPDPALVSAVGASPEAASAPATISTTAPAPG